MPRGKVSGRAGKLRAGASGERALSAYIHSWGLAALRGIPNGKVSGRDCMLRAGASREVYSFAAHFHSVRASAALRGTPNGKFSRRAGVLRAGASRAILRLAAHFHSVRARRFAGFLTAKFRAAPVRCARGRRATCYG